MVIFYSYVTNYWRVLYTLGNSFIVNFPIENGGSLHSYVIHYQRVNPIKSHKNHHKTPFNYHVPMVNVGQTFPMIPC